MDPASPEWTQAFRRMSGRIEQALAAAPTTVERAREGGKGQGGDMTVAIDETAERIVFEELEALHERGARFSAVSEERGEVDFGGGNGAPRVVIDPIDGSLNAKRALPHHALSVAVADGDTVADVALGYVYDFGPREEWIAHRGAGATVNGEPLDATLPERRGRDGRLEMLAIESADPRWVAQTADALVETSRRLRAIGAIAVSLCQVAAARVDGMVSLRRCRSFDAAAAVLVVREAGGRAAFPARDRPGPPPAPPAAAPPPPPAPPAREPRSPVVAARTPETLAALARIPIA